MGEYEKEKESVKYKPYLFQPVCAVPHIQLPLLLLGDMDVAK